MDLLRSFFVGWNGDETDLIQYLRPRGDVSLSSVLVLCLRRATERDSFAWNRGRCAWLISAPYQKQIVDLLTGLLSAEMRGHQYLEPGCSDVQVMVSLDEYPSPSDENNADNL
jgi:hypothetical protein